jgi:thiamine-phosphate pyrophosphorylase
MEKSESQALFPEPPFLYAVLDRYSVPESDLREVCQSLVDGGIGMIQYRAKGLSRESMLEDISTVQAEAGRGKVPVIVNDYPNLASECGADGVHLGMNDPKPGEARKLVGSESIIGLTIHSMDELRAAELDVVDYLSVGSVFPSPTKQSVQVVGTGFIGRVKRESGLPVVAIGGINKNNIEKALEAGADGIAVISALFRGELERNIFTLMEIIGKRLEDC